jgi:hypothetical protein
MAGQGCGKKELLAVFAGKPRHELGKMEVQRRKYISFKQKIYQRAHLRLMWNNSLLAYYEYIKKGKACS